MSDRVLYTTLAFAGASPFLACALLPLAGIEAIPPFGPLDQLANSYGLAIICFLAGVHWATYLLKAEGLPFNLMISSNVVFLIAWFVYLLAETNWSLLAQAGALIILLLIDQRLRRAAIITGEYLQTRFIATTVAVASLLLMALN